MFTSGQSSHRDTPSKKFSLSNIFYYFISGGIVCIGQTKFQSSRWHEIVSIGAKYYDSLFSLYEFLSFSQPAAIGLESYVWSLI